MILHVACLPFPSHQGTQAAVHAMLEASAAAGADPHLLVYAHGAFPPHASYGIHRIPDFPRVRSLRSGPSLGKVALDLHAVRGIRVLTRRLKPTAIVAHHIEAAIAAIAADVRPVIYVAHTTLEQELPAYAPRLPGTWLGAAGKAVERWVCHRAQAVGAVAPSLAATLGERVEYLPVPWEPAEPMRAPDRASARNALGLPVRASVGLYAGNLDAYQGWESVVEATARLRRTRPHAHLLLATASDAAPARREAARRGIADAVSIRRLDGERTRAWAHAASDFAWVPRRTEGGLPIKLLDAFARGLPAVAMERAVAGLAVRRACRVVTDDDPSALAEGARALLRDADTTRTQSERALDYLITHHSPGRFNESMDRLLGLDSLIDGSRLRSSLRPPAVAAPRAR